MDAMTPGIRVPLLKSARLITNTGAPTRETYIQQGSGVYALHGQDARAVIEEVLPWINGSATATEIAERLAQTGGTSQARAEQMLHWLVESGICVEDREEPEDAPLRQHYQTQIQHFGQHVSYPTLCQKRLHTSRVAVIGLEYAGSLLLQHLASAGVGYLRGIGNPQVLAGERPLLHGTPHGQADGGRHTLLAEQVRRLGFATQYEGVPVTPGEALRWEDLLAHCDLAVLVLPRWLPSLIQASNRACLERGIPLLPLWFEAESCHLGPLVVPQETACLLCLELRQHSRWSLSDFRAIQQQDAEAHGPVWDEVALSLPWLTMITALAAQDVITSLTRYRQPASRGTSFAFDSATWQLHATPVLKVPRCPACSRLRQQPVAQPFALRFSEATTV